MSTPNTVLRALLTVVLGAFLAGFGLCGAGGIYFSFQGGGIVTATFGIIGLGIAYALWRALASVWRAKPPASE